METQSNNPLHGITLEMILSRLVEKYGWEELGKRITIQCITNDLSIKSSLKFLKRYDLKPSWINCVSYLIAMSNQP